MTSQTDTINSCQTFKDYLYVLFSCSAKFTLHMSDSVWHFSKDVLCILWHAADHKPARLLDCQYDVFQTYPLVTFDIFYSSSACKNPSGRIRSLWASSKTPNPIKGCIWTPVGNGSQLRPEWKFCLQLCLNHSFTQIFTRKFNWLFRPSYLWEHFTLRCNPFAVRLTASDLSVMSSV